MIERPVTMSSESLPQRRSLVLALAVVSLRCTLAAAADLPRTDAVLAVHRLLASPLEALLLTDRSLAERLARAPSGDHQRLLLQARETALLRSLRALTTVEAMRQGLADDRWPSPERAEDESSRLDLRCRGVLVNQLVEALRLALTKGDDTNRLAALTVIAEMGLESRGSDRERSVAFALVPEMARLAQEASDPAVRVSAVKALCQVNPDPDQAGRVLQTVLAVEEDTVRRGAAEALRLYLHAMTEEYRGYPRSESVEVTPQRLVLACRAVLPRTGKGLADRDQAVRLSCLRAIREGAEALRVLVPDLPAPDERDGFDPKLPSVQQLFVLVQPLVTVLTGQVPAAAHVLRDGDATVRMAASQALETAADARHKLAAYLLQGPLPWEGVPADPLAVALRAVVGPLVQNLTEKDVELRLGALYALESLEDLAAPAAPALARLVDDADPFVRWAVSRTLGKIAPQQAEVAVPALAKLAADANTDVRLSALTNLARYGSAASAALLALRTAVKHRDLDTRVLALEALGIIGEAAASATPDLSGALSAPDVEVRLAAARSLGRIGKPARAAVDALLKALTDADGAVRAAAADALLNIRSDSR
jgi:hypothetical protein